MKNQDKLITKAVTTERSWFVWRDKPEREKFDCHASCSRCKNVRKRNRPAYFSGGVGAAQRPVV